MRIKIWIRGVLRSKIFAAIWTSQWQTRWRIYSVSPAMFRVRYRAIAMNFIE
jgi:hypothetical protein